MIPGPDQIVACPHCKGLAKYMTLISGHIYLDYFSAMVDSSGLLREELSGDDLHPNAKGCALMAPLAEAAIARALKQ